MRIVTVAAGVVLLLGGAAALARDGRATVTRSHLLRTSLRYDAEPGLLEVGCVVSSDGGCRMTIVDGARRKVLAMRSGSRVTVRGVSRGARVCALARLGGACEWRAVST